jgi:hypothetical protein
MSLLIALTVINCSKRALQRCHRHDHRLSDVQSIEQREQPSRLTRVVSQCQRLPLDELFLRGIAVPCCVDIGTPESRAGSWCALVYAASAADEAVARCGRRVVFPSGQYQLTVIPIVYGKWAAECPCRCTAYEVQSKMVAARQESQQWHRQREVWDIGSTTSKPGWNNKKCVK